MKRFILALVCVGIWSVGFTQNKKAIKQFKKDSTEARDYNQLKALIESGNYEFKGDWMYPLGTNRVSLIGNMNKLTISENSATAQLPFRGTRQFASGGNPGINFDGPIDTYEVKYYDEERHIEVNFNVRQSNENYKVTLKINSNSYTRVHVASNKRNSITYSGLVSTIEKI